MQTQLADWIKDTPDAQEADAILRKCVHCGFCLATCPTYNLLGDELDSPRGRIYLMKQVLEGAPVTAKTQFHLDRCLTCRACETTCPSGVQYGRLADIGRALVEEKVGRGSTERWRRALMKWLLPNAALFGAALSVGRVFRFLLPSLLASKIPSPRAEGVRPAARHTRHVLLLEGCVQPAMAPSINAATARVLDRLGISAVSAAEAGCCGALAHHLNDHSASEAAMKRNIDAWWPHLEAGAEAIVVTASGCGTMVSDYGHLLRNDAAYADKARRVSGLFRDVGVFVSQERSALLAALAKAAPANQRVAFHSPCSLQHGLKVRGVVEDLLRAAGYELTTVPDGHLCCGSAGTYSILQPDLSKRLLGNKVAALESGQPQLVATANIGCLSHLEGGLNASTKTPIRHWIELIDERLGSVQA